MNDFDRFLETQLESMLDPVVGTRPPARGKRATTAETVLALNPPELIPAVEIMPVAIVVTPAVQH